ncbi:ATP-dependent helicase [Bacillus manliponensis]|uniref:ATP-dependent helicase n=1 Tax=Bacillus manliponensis TaxID=574376 RepID=A0A073KA71_9BACI|nr:ATP-dependent helicase [Bacillus manliponensis]KEK19193.1 ATP-dependent helicase [Bacillus manliponensis]
MSKVITIRESYDWITEDAVTAAQFEELMRYVEEKYPNQQVLDLRYKRLRFINYVGVIQCSGVRYEIVPKITLSPVDDRKSLLEMLAITGFLPVSFYNQVQNGKEKGDLLTAFVAAFLERLLYELQRGLYKTYERNEGNLYVMRGKLEFSKHIRENAFHQTRAYCAFDEHTENNSLNQLLKCALCIVKAYTKTHALKLYLERCLGYLDRVDSVHCSRLNLQNVTLNRQNERFRDVVLFAKLIVERAAIYSKGSDASSFSFLFKMNMLFEQYIEVALREAVGHKEVMSQHAEKRLLRNKKSNQQNILLKPDFVIDNKVIVDTKWKSATVNEKSRYQQSDIYQMYAYVTAYKEAERCLLLYPKQEGEAKHPVWEVVDTEKTIEMHAVRIDEFAETVSELREMLKD